MKTSLRLAFLMATASLSVTCAQASESRSAAAETQLYRVVVDAALAEVELEEATPQIQLHTVRVAPAGNAAPGDKPEHYTPETNPGLVSAAEALSGVILQGTAAEFDLTRPAEIIVFTNPVYSGDTLAQVSVRAAHLGPYGYSGEGWRASLRWDGTSWALFDWIQNVSESGG